MSNFNNASLIITPNSYKAGKLYSIKPTSGAGDLDVVRATSATRVNEQGLIEIPRTNLLLKSEEFDNASWAKTASTVTANATTSPSGEMTADKLVENNTNASHFILQSTGSLVIGNTYFISIYLKAAERNRGRIRVTGASAIETEFNLQNGTVSLANAIIQNMGNDWYRVGFSLVANATTMSTVINLSNSTTGNSGFNYTYLGDNTSGLFLWGAQLEVGNVATEYIPTTSVIRTRFAGITQDGGSASNIPRLYYTNGSCPSILVEPQRTNLLLRSEEFDNLPWTKTSGVVVTSNSEISPNGTLTADTINFGTSNKIVAQATTLATGVVATGSIYVKGISGQTIQLAVGGVDVLFTLNGNWQKLEATRTSVTSVFNLNTFGGATARIISVWGAQLEAGANATSYIPTVASSVTRNADVISKSGISSLINSEEGCFFVEANSSINGGAFRQFALSNGTDNSRLTIGWSSIVNTLLIRMDVAGVNVVSNNITSFNQTSNNKILIKWGGGNLKTFVNGVERLSLTSLTMPTANLFTKLGFDRGVSASFFEGNVKSVLVFPTQLTDQQCIALTTL